MPHDLDGNFRVAILDGSDIAQKVVALRLIVVQPSNDLVDRGGVDVDDSLTPDDLYARDCRAELVLERVHRWIWRASAMRDVLLSCRLSAGGARSGPHELESGHIPDLV